MKKVTRRDFLARLAGGAAALALPRLTSLARAAADQPTKTNFLILLCDDLGYGDLGCFGHPVIRTPRLDKLAAEGMKLTDCYAAAPVCSPSRAGMLTGRTPNRAGIYDWIPSGSPMHLRRGDITVASLLQQVGYATCHVGKWHCNGKFNQPDQPQPGDQGFDYWFSTQNNAAPSHHNPRNFVRNGKPVGPLEGYSSALIVQEAIDWLGKHRDKAKPFCLFVWFHAPHEPIATAEKFMKMYPQTTQRGQDLYYGNVSQMDFQTGRLLDELDAMKLREDTLVLFTSDNGPETLNRYPAAWRSHGSPGKLRGMKLHLYEGGIRVPGILRWPGKARPGTVCREPICGVDVLPTLCQIAGAKVPADRAIDGASFLPILEGKPVRRTVPLYWQYDRALGKPKVALRDGDWKVLADARLEGLELYNLRDDPSETTDLAAKEPQRLRALGDVLRKMHAQVKAEGPDWPAPAPRPTKKKPDAPKAAARPAAQQPRTTP